jgi:hypothetical protein
MTRDSMKNQITEFPTGILVTCRSYGLYIKLEISAKTNVSSRNSLLEKIEFYEKDSIFHKRSVYFDCNFQPNIEAIRPTCPRKLIFN